MGKTKTKAFGTGKREGHDASSFYNRRIFGTAGPASALGDHEVEIQYHPAETEYVNLDPFVLLLWRPTYTPLPVPPLIFV